MDTSIVSMGQKILDLKRHYYALRNLASSYSIPFKFPPVFAEVDSNDSRRAFALIHEQPQRLRIALQTLARFEVFSRISQWPEIHRVEFLPASSTPTLRIHGAKDISLELRDAKSSTFELESPSSHHAIITGPNGGGKSSFLRSILQNVLFAHTFGVAPCMVLQMTPLNWIASGLHLRDSPGVYSMFEMEVLFASACLRNTTPGLVLFDELFHSTNPPDGARTAQEFLRQLWTKSNILSIVSTHVFPLVESAPSHVQRICCNAQDLANGDILYSYTVQPGICRVSSVKKVWERFRFQAPRLPRITSPDQDIPVKEK